MGSGDGREKCGKPEILRSSQWYDFVKEETQSCVGLVGGRVDGVARNTRRMDEFKWRDGKQKQKSDSRRKRYSSSKELGPPFSEVHHLNLACRMPQWVSWVW